MILRKAKPDEAAECYRCIEDAREFHNSLGFVQWHPDYPTQNTIMEDIKRGLGFVFAEEDNLIGYCYIVTGDEPAYQTIDGVWCTERAYAVVHRMALSAKYRGSGLSHEAFDLIKDYCHENGVDAIRVDTQDENKVMQHILSREGFVYCGLITFDGGPKLAYEWDR